MEGKVQRVVESGVRAWSGERSGVESRVWSGVELGRDSFERPLSKALEAQ